MKGFKGMLSDRLPFVVEVALKMCGAKGRWIDHTYKHFIGIYVREEDRRQAVFKILGPKYQFDFARSIDYDNILDEEREYWNYVQSWVEYVQKMYAIIQTFYDYTKTLNKGMSHKELINMISDKYHIPVDKAKVLCDSFQST